MLVSFAVPKGPSADPAEKRFAAYVEDHPVEYADFEGVIPDGNYGAGPSIVWDRGAWVNLPGEKHGLEHGKLLFDLFGHKLRGRWTLVRTNKPGGKDWLLIKKPDAYARQANAPEPWPEQSVFSGVDVHELPGVPALRESLRTELDAAKLPRREVDPLKLELMLAERAPEPFSAKGWLFELKYDGFRALAARHNAAAKLRLRGGGDATATFPELSRAIAGLRHDCIIDGELVALDEKGHPSFARLQQRSQLKRAIEIQHATVTNPITLFAFDLLSLEGHDLRGLPLTERKAHLKRLLPPVGPIRFADHVEEEGAQLYEAARKMNLEGVVGKRADSPYLPGRRREWLKVRGDRTAEFAVVGFTAPSRGRSGFGALDLALFDGVGFRYAGNVGTGFSEALLRELHARLLTAKRATPAFSGTPVPGKPHTWVEPELVVEVAFMEWTKDGLLRQPKFLRVREDKTPRDCVRDAPIVEQAPPAPAERSVVLSNVEKIFWPEEGITKGELINYYRDISPWLLPYLRDRPVVLTRYPDGVNGKSFFQKDAPPFVPPWLQTARIWSEQTQREIDHFVCNDVESLVYVANLGTIPLHVWASRTQNLQSPDWTIIDLDPKGAPFEHVVEIAKALHRLCEELELPSFVKTSGSSGLHICIPLGGRCTFEEARGLAELLSRVVVGQLPAIATVERNVNARGGRVYLDCYQNGHGKLLACAFSVRPVPGAAVSMPLAWSEVNLKNHPRAFTIKDAVKRMKRKKVDPFLGVLGAPPDLIKVLQRLAQHPALKR